MTDVIVVTDDSTREELVTALHNVNATAKAISRRGYVGLQSPEYKRRHDNINALLTELLAHA